MKNHIKALAAVLFFVLLFAAIYLHFSGKESKSSPHVEAVKKMEKEGAPLFSAKAIDGSDVQVVPTPGKVLIINFWASWCGPCIEEIPSLVKLAEHFKDKVEILAVSGDESMDDIQVFLKSFPVLQGKNIKIIWDKDRSISNLYSVQRLPESFILRPSGKLEKKVIGSISWFTPESTDYIEGLTQRKD